jgi:hypothetical protein
MKSIKIFFAIPCGEFFSIQNGLIKSVCNGFDIEPIIVEDHSSTENLWEKISKGIDTADYFIADISSLSPNIILELGYTIREKKSKYYGIFVSSSAEVPVDLQGFTLQKYSSFKEFKDKLIKWIQYNVTGLSSSKAISPKKSYSLPHEDFLDRERFLRLWTNPPYASFYFTPEGLRFSDTHFPIMTNYLGLLQNYEFTFRAKIIRGALGWVVKGTKSFRSVVPEFCVMFNINTSNLLTPHIFTLQNPVPDVGYHVFPNTKIKGLSQDWHKNWFEITTRVKNDVITVIHEGNTLFTADFNQYPYKEVYASFPFKQGEVGFRCHPNEESIIHHMNVKEI